MAVIDNLSTSLSSFKVNGSSKALVKNIGTYGTHDLLNGGEVLENELEYAFTISGLLGHSIKRIIVKSLLLTSSGELSSSRKISLQLNSLTFNGIFNSNDSLKTIINTEFAINEEVVDNDYIFTLKVTSNDSESFSYGLVGILVELSDIPYSINLKFSGPSLYRYASSISVVSNLVKRGAQEVSFTKDITSEYDPSIHNTEGRVYFLLDGIFVDGYLHGVNTPATNIKAGIVKTQDVFETDENGGIIAPDDTGVAATPLLVYSVTLPATTEIRGTVVLQNTFATDEGGIIAPTETGIAASPLLVYNTLATAKAYVDDLIDAVLGGIEAPIHMYIEGDDNTTSAITDSLTFSNEFELDGRKMLHINWLEIVN